MQKRWLLLLLALLLTGCAAPLVHPPVEAEPACRQFFTELDRAVDEAGVRDEGPHRVPGFPYLRVDRFLASFRDEVAEAPRFAAWAGRLAQLDREARAFEIANLPQAERSGLAGIAPAGGDLLQGAERCRARLIESELAVPENRRLLLEQATVPDDYVTAWRIIGLYPVTALFVKVGVARWHRETEEIYALRLEQLPLEGTLRAWAPPDVPRLTASEVAAVLKASADNPLGIPEPDTGQREALFASFAPQWLIDTVDENDLPGTPYFAASAATAQVDTSHPVIFRRLSHTRFGGEVLLQLNYIVWFKARPPASAFDIYAGALDGVNFRVTLRSDGRPLLFDTIHNCGCYHMFFPVAPLVFDEGSSGFWSEEALVPQSIDVVGETPVLHLANRTHYLDRISFTPEEQAVQYRWDEYARLRSLELPGGSHRSLFDKHGIVDGSERPERVLLWPMGIRSPGAMRQWGRHPTAFFGRRHFDDPYLIETLFYLPAEGEMSR
jgi:hypothetical protein